MRVNIKDPTMSNLPGKELVLLLGDNLKYQGVKW